MWFDDFCCDVWCEGEGDGGDVVVGDCDVGCVDELVVLFFVVCFEWEFGEFVVLGVEIVVVVEFGLCGWVGKLVVGFVVDDEYVIWEVCGDLFGGVVW